MLDRLADSFDVQRRFVANASHELRSPLTVIRSEAEVALANPEPDLDELRGMAESVVARQPAHRGAARQPADPRARPARPARAARRWTWREAAAEVVRDAAPATPRREGVRLTCALEPAPGRGRRRAARAAGRQPGRERRALQPARRLRRGAHARRGSAPSSCGWRTAGRAIDPADAPRLAEPFERLAREADARGAGLGLSIVRAVDRGARRHAAPSSRAPRAGWRCRCGCLEARARPRTAARDSRPASSSCLTWWRDRPLGRRRPAARRPASGRARRCRTGRAPPAARPPGSRLASPDQRSEAPHGSRPNQRSDIAPPASRSAPRRRRTRR